MAPSVAAAIVSATPPNTPNTTPAAVAVTLAGEQHARRDGAEEQEQDRGGRARRTAPTRRAPPAWESPTVSASAAASADERERRETHSGERATTERIGGQPGHQRAKNPKPHRRLLPGSPLGGDGSSCRTQESGVGR